MSAIVNCVAYRQGKRLGTVGMEEIPTVLGVPGTFVWLGLHEPDLALLRQVQFAFGLHDLAVEDALDAHQRPKLEAYGDSVFVVLNTAQLVEDEVVVGETHLFVGPNYVVSVRHGASSAAGTSPASSQSEPTQAPSARGRGSAASRRARSTQLRARGTRRARQVPKTRAMLRPSAEITGSSAPKPPALTASQPEGASFSRTSPKNSTLHRCAGISTWLA